MTPHDWKPTLDWNTSKGGSDVSLNGYLYKNVQECARCSCRTRSGAALLQFEILRGYGTEVRFYEGPLDRHGRYMDCDEAVASDIMMT